METLKMVGFHITATNALKGYSNTASSQEGHPTINNFYSESTRMPRVLLSRATGGSAFSCSLMRFQESLNQKTEIPI